jgi:hypothetical protein
MRKFTPCTNSFAPLLAYASLLLSKNANARNGDSSFQQLLLGSMVDMVRHASLTRRGTYRFNTGNPTTGLVAIRLGKLFEDEEFVYSFGPLKVTHLADALRQVFPQYTDGHVKMIHMLLECTKWSKVMRPTVAQFLLSGHTIDVEVLRRFPLEHIKMLALSQRNYHFRRGGMGGETQDVRGGRLQ